MSELATTQPAGAAIEAGLCSVTFRGLEWRHVIEIACEAGLSDVEWGGDVHVPAGDLATAADVAQATADAGLRATSYGSYLHAGRLGEKPDDTVARVLDTAAALGVPNVRVWASGEAASTELATVCAAAADRGLVVSLEYHPGTATETPEGALFLLSSVDAPNLMTYWQPDPTRPTDGQLEDLAAVAGRLSHLHVFSWRSDRSRLALVEGEELWPRAFTVAASGPQPPGGHRVAFLEFVRDDDPGQLVADAEVLRRWLRGGR